MKKSLSLTGMLLLLALSVASAFAQEQTSKPEYKDGEFWQYRVTEKNFAFSSSDALNGSYQLTYSQGKLNAIALDESKEAIDVSPGSRGEPLVLLFGGTDERPDLKFPLSVGQKWNYQYKYTPVGVRQSQTRSAEINVTGMEQITTPAGSFKTFKIQKTVFWSRGRGGQTGNSTIYYFSPETKSVVKSTLQNDEGGGTREIDLVKFGSGN